eukprot:TRINITY_DN7508_c0_g1_i1.p1 TRINITY_DN7508_c0_g1~~TRINITY_DN7508_c0_g1_i1.p1  ORF type:complete len:361 (+),score=92.70 TRINITY_DN7508_c0_g1_i1:132-1085(+)
MFELVTSTTLETKRPPMDLAIALDRSGSMTGPKIIYSLKAIEEIINVLTPEDRLFLVQYDDSVEVVFEGHITDKQELIKRVHAISPGGSTNLSGGMAKAYKLLNSLTDKHGLQRLFLFSDGQANSGITSQEGIFGMIKQFVQGGVTVSTFGLGDDFDEEIMRGIAERGSGDYFFIENSDEIVNMVTKAIQGLLGIVGTNGNFKLHAQPGTTVKRIFGPETPTDGYDFGDLPANNVRNILAEVEVTPENVNQINVVEYEITYQTVKQPVSTVVSRGMVTMECTTDFEKLSLDELSVTLAVKIKEIGQKYIRRTCLGVH